MSEEEKIYPTPMHGGVNPEYDPESAERYFHNLFHHPVILDYGKVERTPWGSRYEVDGWHSPRLSLKAENLAREALLLMTRCGSSVGALLMAHTASIVTTSPVDREFYLWLFESIERLGK